MDGGEWKLVEELEIDSDASGFWKGLSVWVDRPHILNKRLCVVSEIAQLTIQRGGRSDELGWKNLVQKLRNVEATMDAHDFKNRVESAVEDIKRLCSVRDVMSNDAELSLRLRQHLPKRRNKHRGIFEIVLKDLNDSLIACLPYACVGDDDGLLPVSPLLTYAVRHVGIKPFLIQFFVLDKGNVRNGSSDVSWLATRVLPKICQWIKETANEPLTGRKTLSSLTLVSTSRYNLLYNDLKLKYGKHLVEIWPERTDPTKFVYQIIAVASYLIVLWEEERERLKLEKKQSFVDLGCGNGLLTNILSSEGHSGIGIDVKRRKIWGLYGPQTKLLEQPIVPSSRDLFPDYDWVIGSHSDELTPWIPVIAARSSRTTKFFLLPCCAHNFDAKFQRRNSKVSIYEDYMDFVGEIAAVCGFEARKDKLRIPSTKRICFVGSKRSYSVAEWPQVDENIGRLISSQRSCRSGESDPDFGEDPGGPDEGSWGTNFHARCPVQAVRNCTRLNEDLKTSIVKRAVEALLENIHDAEVVSVGDDGKKIWHKGGCLELSDLASKIPNDNLQKLKAEFGGLKTLLRNHYHIFQVNRTRVTLRNYKAETPFPRKRKPGRPTSTKSTAKTKPCWFHENHPDGCPLPSEDCYFIHSGNEPTVENAGIKT